MTISKCGLRRRVLEFGSRYLRVGSGFFFIMIFQPRWFSAPLLSSSRHRIDVTKLDSGMQHIDSGYRDVGRSDPVRAIPAFQLVLLENSRILRSASSPLFPAGNIQLALSTGPRFTVRHLSLDSLTRRLEIYSVSVTVVKNIYWLHVAKTL